MPALGTAPGWQQLPTAWVIVQSLAPRSCCPWGDQLQGSLEVDACLPEPIASSCLLAGIFAVYRKNTSCSDLRNMGKKPILVTPKNPCPGCSAVPGVPQAQAGSAFAAPAPSP